jgi:hypothetical protein
MNAESQKGPAASQQGNPSQGGDIGAAQALSSPLNLDALSELWKQQAPIDSDALLRVVRARRRNQRIKNYLEVALTIATIGFLIYVMRKPLSAEMWAFVGVSLPSVIWLQWLTLKTRRQARYVEPQDAQSLIQIAIAQCQTEIRLAKITRRCCFYGAIFGAFWLPWLIASHWPLEGRDVIRIPFAVLWWVFWLGAMAFWAARKKRRETAQLSELQARVEATQHESL